MTSRNQREGRYSGHYGGHLRQGYAGAPSAFEASCVWGERNGDMLRPKRRAWTSHYYTDKATVARMMANVLELIDRYDAGGRDAQP